MHGVAENDDNSDSRDDEGEATDGLPGTFVNKTNFQLTLEREMNISHASKHVYMVKISGNTSTQRRKKRLLT